MMIIQNAQTGRLRGKVTEEALQGLLDEIAKKADLKKTKIVNLRRVDMSDDEPEESSGSDPDDDSD